MFSRQRARGAKRGGKWRGGALLLAPALYRLWSVLGLWSIALLAGSRAALGVALFQHAYIWVHMYTVEAPDMRVIYGNGR